MAGFPIGSRAMTFIATRNRDVARRFYGDTLGFRVMHEDDFAIVFDLNGTMLRISTVKDHKPVVHTVLGWQVPDIVAAAKALLERGVTFNTYEGLEQDELGIWTAPGSTNRVAWFLDPDGNNLSIARL
ncbi:MAG TPA: VOC family protein [Rhizomicrobium sp.]|nr:VOC family protein [Rhizomicrobium sp.]